VSEHSDNCLMCAVRALTEGTPKTWAPATAGETVTGVVLKTGKVVTDFGQAPYVDLWLGGHERIRISAFGNRLRHALDEVDAQIGDTLSVWFDGLGTVTKGPMEGKPYKAFSANVQRGHGSAAFQPEAPRYGGPGWNAAGTGLGTVGGC
jgi:hypothetical protein